MKKATLLLLFIFSLPFFAKAIKITGKVTDNKDNPLPYASVYIQNSSTGTTTNVEGFYTLDVPKGEQVIVFQYIGYQQVVKKVIIGDTPQNINVQLQPQSVELMEVVVDANAEDPAYAIIRKAIAKRQYYLEQVNAFSCDVYIKGNQKLLDAPKTFLGEEIGDLDGSLDSNRQGIVYLSESVSKLYFEAPNEYKEVMISSKVSGNDNGFSFNQARAMDFNFYENRITLGRPIVSPIADAALSFYDYELLGTFYDENQQLINQIKVIPKNEYGSTFQGTIYITENLWNIYSTDLFLTKTATKIPVLDTVRFNQVHIPIEGDKWRILSQSISFRLSVLTFDIAGIFTGIFTNYDLSPSFKKGFFTNEILVVQDSANKKDDTYWETIRPIPLTLEETKDYIKKDSISIVRSSKSYLDSLDNVQNRFKLMNILTGYTYNKSYNKFSLAIAAPINTLQFNTVQGLTLAAEVTLRKEYDDIRGKWLEIKPRVQYGFSDKQVRGSLEITHQFNRIKYSLLQFSAGREATQFNPIEPISTGWNTVYTLFDQQNYMKLYDRLFAKAGVRYEVFNGGFLYANVTYNRRTPLENTTDYNWYRGDDRTFEANDFVDNPNYSFTQHDALIVESRLRVSLGQKYLSYPGRKIILGSKYPTLDIFYKKGIRTGSSVVNFDWLGFRTRYNKSLGTVGTSSINISGGFFLNDENVQFPDFQHFNGNQTRFGKPQEYLASFNLLPYYQRSTTRPQVQMHYAHDFNGFLLDKIPGVKKLGFSTIIGGSALYTEDQGWYYEANIGIDRIGVSLFRFLRVDYFLSFDKNGLQNSGVILGLNL